MNNQLLTGLPVKAGCRGISLHAGPAHIIDKFIDHQSIDLHSSSSADLTPLWLLLADVMPSYPIHSAMHSGAESGGCHDNF